MDFVYQLASVENTSRLSKSIPQWKLQLARLPALTTMHAASALADVDYYKFTYNPEPSDQEVEADREEGEKITRWMRVIEKVAGSHELPAELIHNADDIDCDIWMFSHKSFASWCLSKGIVCPIPIDTSSPNISIELDAAKAKISVLEAAIHAATVTSGACAKAAGPIPTNIEKPLLARERNTLLTILAALCNYSAIDPKSRGAAAEIAKLTDEISAPITEETILKMLKRIPEALETRMK